MRSNEIVLNKVLIKKYGLEETLLLTELINKSCGTKEQFEYSISQMQNEINLSRKTQTRIIKKLIDLDIIKLQIQGMPAKRYFKLNYENLPDCLKETQNQEPKHETRTLIAVTEKPTKPKTNKTQEEFEQLWQQYPNKQGKQKAFVAYQKAIKNGVKFDEVMQGIQNYIFFIEQTRLDQQYVKHGSTWFNQRGWEDDYTVIEREPKPRDSVYERNRRDILRWLEESGEEVNDFKTDVGEFFRGIR